MNIYITGTPGVGKTTLAELVAENTGLELLSIKEAIFENKLYDSYDSEADTYDVDDEVLFEFFNDKLEERKYIMDHHSCFLDPDFLDIVVVLRTEHDILGKRLQARNYPHSKVIENLEAEMFDVCQEEAEDIYEGSNTKVVVLQSNNDEDMDNNVEIICNMLIDQ
ncbi:hypothetical protein PCE1_003809 [Barthelona sp. PCE]